MFKIKIDRFIRDVLDPNLEKLLRQSIVDDKILTGDIYPCFYCGVMLPEFYMIPNKVIFGDRIAPHYFRCCAECFEYYNLDNSLYKENRDVETST